MMDVSQLMKLAGQMSGAAPSAAADGIGPRMTLALLSALEDRTCSCEPCLQLRAIVAGMREAAKAATTAPPSSPLTLA